MHLHVLSFSLTLNSRVRMVSEWGQSTRYWVPLIMKLPVVRYSPVGAVFDTWKKYGGQSPVQSSKFKVQSANLMVVDPPGRRDDVSFPCSAIAHGHSACLSQSPGGNWASCGKYFKGQQMVLLEYEQRWISLASLIFLGSHAPAFTVHRVCTQAHVYPSWCAYW